MLKFHHHFSLYLEVAFIIMQLTNPPVAATMEIARGDSHSDSNPGSYNELCGSGKGDSITSFVIHIMGTGMVWVL